MVGLKTFKLTREQRVAAAYAAAVAEESERLRREGLCVVNSPKWVDFLNWRACYIAALPDPDARILRRLIAFPCRDELQTDRISECGALWAVAAIMGWKE